MRHNICIAGLISLSSGLPLTSSSSILQRVRVSVSLCIRARVPGIFISLLSRLWIIHLSEACVCLYRLPWLEAHRAVWMHMQVRVHVVTWLSLCFLRLSSRLLTSSNLSLSLSLSHYILLFPFPTFSLFLFWCKSVCECVYVGPFLDYAFSPLVLEFMRGPDRGIMDGGTWLPLRIRYLPRWHHTGSYQLYPGEEIAGALNTCFSNWRKCRFCSQGSNEANMLDSRRFFMLKIQFGFFRPVKEVKEKYHKMEIAC